MSTVKPTVTPRQVMDPTGTLPPVELIIDDSKKQAKSTLVPEPYLIQTKGRTIGNATLSHDRSTNEAWFNGVNVVEEVDGEKIRGRGYGMAAYLAAIEQAHQRGETFRTHDWSQTDEAVKVWTKFIDAGIAEVVQPFQPYVKETPDDDSQQYNFGHIRIPPTSTD